MQFTIDFKNLANAGDRSMSILLVNADCFDIPEIDASGSVIPKFPSEHHKCSPAAIFASNGVFGDHPIVVDDAYSQV